MNPKSLFAALRTLSDPETAEDEWSRTWDYVVSVASTSTASLMEESVRRTMEGDNLKEKYEALEKEHELLKASIASACDIHRKEYEALHDKHELLKASLASSCGKIMNISYPLGSPAYSPEVSSRTLYKTGHRDARQSAWQLIADLLAEIG